MGVLSKISVLAVGVSAISTKEKQIFLRVSENSRPLAKSVTEDVDSNIKETTLECHPTCGPQEFCSDPQAARQLGHEVESAENEKQGKPDIDAECPMCMPLEADFKKACRDANKSEDMCIQDIASGTGEIGQKLAESGAHPKDVITACGECIQNLMGKHKKAPAPKEPKATKETVPPASKATDEDFVNHDDVPEKTGLVWVGKRHAEPHCVARLPRDVECGFHSMKAYDRVVCEDGLRCQKFDPVGEMPPDAKDVYKSGSGGPAKCLPCEAGSGNTYIAPGDQHTCHHETVSHGWFPDFVQSIIPGPICAGRLCDHQSGMHVVEPQKSTMCITVKLDEVQCPHEKDFKASGDQNPHCCALSEAQADLERQLTGGEVQDLTSLFQSYCQFHANYEAGKKTCDGKEALNVPKPPGSIMEMLDGYMGTGNQADHLPAEPPAPTTTTTTTTKTEAPPPKEEPTTTTTTTAAPTPTTTTTPPPPPPPAGDGGDLNEYTKTQSSVTVKFDKHHK